MLENPEILQEMIKETGAKSTDLQSPESVEHLCSKCKAYACEWKKTADQLWKEPSASAEWVHKLQKTRGKAVKKQKKSRFEKVFCL